MDISKDITVFKGVVIGYENNVYSTTEVEGRIVGYDGYVSGYINSTVTRHQEQTFWLKLPDGTERRFIVIDCDVQMRTEHHATFVLNNHLGTIERVQNHTTGYVWNTSKSRVALGGMLFGFPFVSATLSLPYINVLTGIMPNTGWFKKYSATQFIPLYKWRLLFLAVSLISTASLTAWFSDSFKKKLPDDQYFVSSDFQYKYLHPIKEWFAGDKIITPQITEASRTKALEHFKSMKPKNAGDRRWKEKMIAELSLPIDQQIQNAMGMNDYILWDKNNDDVLFRNFLYCLFAAWIISIRMHFLNLKVLRKYNSKVDNYLNK
jgi:hypothetical protein